ncbi:FAD-binding protein [Pseudomonas veronii]|uniref:FAD-binding protein n=1 Tax=Pseudomonas veronii TaxID=76761 RepID=UPI001C431EC7|nr:FAD-binding protein [Pseudomonas veronii]
MTSNSAKRDLRVVVMGAGMAGILSAIKLREAGFGSVTVYEKAAPRGRHLAGEYLPRPDL